MVITATLKKERRQQILSESGRESWPPLLPTQARIAVRSTEEAEKRFGQLLPIRMEYWSDPLASEDAEDTRGRLIALIEHQLFIKEGDTLGGEKQ